MYILWIWWERMSMHIRSIKHKWICPLTWRTHLIHWHIVIHTTIDVVIAHAGIIDISDFWVILLLFDGMSVFKPLRVDMVRVISIEIHLGWLGQRRVRVKGWRSVKHFELRWLRFLEILFDIEIIQSGSCHGNSSKTFKRSMHNRRNLLGDTQTRLLCLSRH